MFHVCDAFSRTKRVEMDVDVTDIEMKNKIIIMTGNGQHLIMSRNKYSSF